MPLTDLQINQRIAALTPRHEIVEGHDNTLCYVETGKGVVVFDVLHDTTLWTQLLKENELDITWNGEQVTIHLPLRLISSQGEFVSFTDCDGNIPRAICLLLLHAVGNDK